MKLISLYIKEYKNLKNLTIDFKYGNGLTMLIGTNGSGKSNVIEVLSKIFYDCYYSFTSGLEYHLVYESKSEATDIISTLKIIKEENKKLTMWRSRSDIGIEDEWISISQIEWNKYLPTKIITLYCGDDSKMWSETYKAAYDSYKRGVYNRTTNIRNYMMYVNKYYWQIALIAQSLQSEDAEINQSYFGIDGIKKVSFTFLKSYVLENTSLKGFIEIINPQNVQIVEMEWEDFKEKIIRSGYSVDIVSEYLSQLFMPKGKKIINKIDITTSSYFNFDNLSEGIKRTILIRYIVSVCSLRNSLVLMDEPDSHIAENRKNDILKIITDVESGFAIQFLISSHSPTFVEAVSNAHIVALKSNEQSCVEQVTDSKMELLQYLTGNRMNIFNNRETVYCESGENGFDKRLLEILFPAKNIISTGNCEDVINKTKLHNLEFPNSAIGIIDADYNTVQRESALAQKRIYMLPVLEIENVLMDFAIISSVKTRICASDNDVEKTKKYFFNLISKDKQNQSAKHTSNTFINEVKISLEAENRDIEAFKANVKKITDSKKISTIYRKRLADIEKNVHDQNYSDLVKRVNLNHKIDHFFNEHLLPKYTQRVFNIIDNDEELKKFLRRKYYYFLM